MNDTILYISYPHIGTILSYIKVILDKLQGNSTHMLKTAQNKGKIQCRHMESGSDVAGKYRRKRQQEHPAIEGTGGRRRLSPSGCRNCLFLSGTHVGC